MPTPFTVAMLMLPVERSWAPVGLAQTCAAGRSLPDGLPSAVWALRVGNVLLTPPPKLKRMSA